MAKFFITSSMLVLSFFMYCSLVFSQGPAPAPAVRDAAGPAPSGPTDIIKILAKAGAYKNFIRFLKSTHISDQINTQLNKLDQSLTVFAPTDDAFDNLKQGVLNSFSDQQKFELVQFHVLPSFYSAAQFQTASNPLRTQAGGSIGQFPLNVTIIGNSVNITTDMVNTRVAKTIYTDGQLAVYQVDKVLLPYSLFEPSPPAPAPLKPKKQPSNDIAPILTSDGTSESRLELRAISSVFFILGAFCL